MVFKYYYICEKLLNKTRSKSTNIKLIINNIPIQEAKKEKLDKM